MSLNLTIVNPFGIWQSSDHRLTNTSTGQIENDYSMKHIMLRCPDGSAVLAYAGMGSLSSIEISTWIRETLRGESRTVDESLIRLRENATHDLAKPLFDRGWQHMFSVGVFLNGQPWMVQIRNFQPNSTGWGPPFSGFITVAKPVPAAGQAFAFPQLPAIQFSRLQVVCGRKPRKPQDFSKLLASVNRRVAETNTFVSQHCVTTYLPPAGEPFQYEFHRLGASAPDILEMPPTLLFGVDTTDMMKSFSLPPEQLQAAAEEAVTTRNRLRTS